MESDASGLAGELFWIILGLFSWIAMWKVFIKAGRPGWAVLIPFYNLYVQLKIAGKPGWWLIFYFIPIANIIIFFMVAVAIAKAFNKGSAFGIFLLGILPFIGYPILGFGKSTYVGETATPNQPPPTTPQPQPVPV